MQGELDVKIYYEDTDCLGLVYHASYVRFFERGRTEYIGQVSRSVADWNAAGYLFAVYKMEITFRKAARLGDLLQVTTRFEPRRSDYRICLRQHITRAKDLVAETLVHLVCLDEKHAVRTFPDELLALGEGAPADNAPIGAAARR